MNGDRMHKVTVPSQMVRTDLILEQENSSIHHSISKNQDGIVVTHTKAAEGCYITIEFQDVTDHEESLKVVTGSLVENR